MISFRYRPRNAMAANKQKLDLEDDDDANAMDARSKTSMQVLADDQKRAIKIRADHEAAVKLLGEAKALVSNGKTKQAQEFLNRCTQQLQAANLLWRLQDQIDAVQARCNMATRFW